MTKKNPEDKISKRLQEDYKRKYLKQGEWTVALKS